MYNGWRQPTEDTRAMKGKQNKQEGYKKRVPRKDIGIKIWEFGVKIRELSGNERTKEKKLFYKYVALMMGSSP